MISTKNKSPNIPTEVSIPPDMDDDLHFDLDNKFIHLLYNYSRGIIVTYYLT